MKWVCALLGIILFQGAAAAQIADIYWTTSPLPYSRVLKHTSLRLDALQLSLPVEDETNYVGLDSWGDNPAGLIDNIGHTLKFTWGHSSYGSDADLSRELSGLYFSHSSESAALEVEGLRDAYVWPAPEQSENIGGSAAFGVKTNNLLFGALWTGTRYESNDWGGNSRTTSDRTLLGGGTTFKFSNSALTLGVDGGVNKSRDSYDFASDSNWEGPEYGVQTILKFDGGALGLKAHNGEMDSENVYSYARYKYNDSYRTGAVRLFKRFESMPVNFGAEWESTKRTYKASFDYVALPSDGYKREYFYDIKAAGLAWRLEPGLLGFEVREESNDFAYSGTSTDSGLYRTYAAGFEYPVLSHVGIILSYLRGTSKWTYTDSSNPLNYSSESSSLYSLGGGLTVKPSEFIALVASYKYIDVEGTIVSSLKVQTSFCF